MMEIKLYCTPTNILMLIGKPLNPAPQLLSYTVMIDASRIRSNHLPNIFHEVPNPKHMKCRTMPTEGAQKEFFEMTCYTHVLQLHQVKSGLSPFLPMAVPPTLHRQPELTLLDWCIEHKS